MSSHILFFDEKEIMQPFAEQLKYRRGIDSKFFDVASSTDQKVDYTFTGLIYEPYFAFNSPTLRASLDKLLLDARSRNIPRLALTTQDESVINDEKFLAGRDYDFFLLKPAPLDKIVSCLQR